MKARQVCRMVVLASVLLLPGPALPEGKTPAAKPETATKAWTLEQAMEQLAHHPRDAYLQYVTLQLARRQDKLEETLDKMRRLRNLLDRLGREDPERRVDLFSLFSGRLAVQESLQLDQFGGRAPARRNAPMNVAPAPGLEGLAKNLVEWQQYGFPAQAHGLSASPASGQWLAMYLAFATPETVLDFLNKEFEAKALRDKDEVRARRRQERMPLLDLAGPNIKSHFWHGMLAGKKPVVSSLSRCVPEDSYLVEFRSVNKLLHAAEELESWSRFLANQSTQDARTFPTMARMQAQLAVRTEPLLRPFYDLAVSEVAVTGSDLYVHEGSDLTLLFRLKQPGLFRAKMKSFILEAQNLPGAKSETGKLLGVDFIHVGTPDRAVWVFAADPAPDLHIRSNSKIALERVLAAIKGKGGDGQPVTRLGHSLELKYMRTLMPLGAAEEDGFVYLSDPFIRRMVGPEFKITAYRRQVCHNHLRMLGHAVQMYRTEQGKDPASLSALAAAGCCPGEFNQGNLCCPSGGKYSLAADGTPVCSVHGRANHLKPCCEIPLREVNGEEADLYRDFLEEYNQYWRTYFDPIAIRVQVGPKRYRAETIILPLIDKSIYTELAQSFKGGETALDRLPVPRRNLFTANVGFDGAKLSYDLDRRIDVAAARARIQGLHDSLPQSVDPPVALFFGLAPAGARVALRQDPAANPDVEFNITSKHFLDLWTSATQRGLPVQFPWSALVQEIVVAEKDDWADAIQSIEQTDFGKKLKLRDVLSKGIDYQFGLHTYDTPLMFDLNWAEFFGFVFNNARPTNADADVTVGMGMMYVVPYVGALSSVVTPMYMSVPVRDAKVVDGFLTRLDDWLPEINKMRENSWGPLEVKGDFYKLQTKGKVAARAVGIRFGPIRWRFFYARIGDGLYLANQPSVLDDIQAVSEERAQGKAAPAGNEPRGHAMLRLRPRHWDQALPGFNLGWAENQREACLNNVGSLTSVARGFPDAKNTLSWDDRAKTIRQSAEKMHGVHYYCPDGGRYVLAKDGKAMVCTIHGSTLDPRQPDAPLAASNLARLMGSLNDVHATLTFLPEGLRAVVVIERK